ncbi:hypothetical protein [Cryobacterium sp. TMT2-14]|uniref:hypothetical protein n=1 Tax=Cryobacterium sp. TMT2-14 TaxID=1259245 RepID=UPI00106CEF74|nr:hypothetical protein [Cryobacterium sp. TMT2-14]TFC36634.1 hypothetical protein E3O28_07885 [Cryobacterium sp. TMT2-14]
MLRRDLELAWQKWPCFQSALTGTTEIPGEHSLTLEEFAIVGMVPEAVGLVDADRAAAYLTILAT